MKKLWIVQPYIPAYRVPFFEGLKERLFEDGIEMHVLASAPGGELAGRGDSASADWLTPVRQRTLHFGSRRLVVSETSRYWRGAAGVIVPLEGSNLDAYSALSRRHSGLRVGLWGHVNNYVSVPNKLDVRLETWQMRLSDHVFSYTDGGREHAVALGIDPAKVTSVHNTVDVESLMAARDRVTDEDIERFRRETGIGDRPVLSFIGGLDGSKRIGFLAESLDRLWQSDPEVRILVGGRGDQASLLDRATARGQAISLGRVGDETKALMGAVSSALVCPGRVGLVAVEALALGLPLVTTRWRFHAPEIEYLTEGTELFSSRDSVTSFVREMQKVFERPRSAAGQRPPALSDMVLAFSQGVVRMLDR